MLSFDVFYVFLFPEDLTLGINEKKLKFNIFPESQIYSKLDAYGDDLIDELFEFIGISEPDEVRSYTVNTVKFSLNESGNLVRLDLIYYKNTGIWDYGSVEDQVDNLFYQIKSNNYIDRENCIKYIRNRFFYLYDYDSSKLYELGSISDAFIEHLLEKRGEWHLIAGDVHE
jgi:hypothetical protein